MPESSPVNKPLLLKGGTIVNHDVTFKADVLINDGIIQAIGEELACPSDTRVVDVSDKLLLPGGVDLDCHIGVADSFDPVADTYVSAGKAALLGGTTTIVNTINAHPDRSLISTYEQFLSSIQGHIGCDYSVCFQLASFSPETEKELVTLVQCKGVVLYSVRLGSKLLPVKNDEQCINEEEFYNLLKSCRQLGALPILEATVSVSLSQKLSSELQDDCPNIGPEVHSLNSPEQAEANTILQGSLFSQYAGFCCPLLISRIHSEAALRCFIEQRRMCRGLLYGQTSVSAIAAPLVAINSNDCANGVFTNSKDWATAASYVNCPPLRPDVQLSQRLLTHLVSEDLVSVGSGHRAITTAVRAAFGLKNPLKIPHGIAALGCRMIVLWHHGVESGSLDPCTFVKVTSTNPARLMNLYPQKGRIAVGSDADIIIWSNSFKQENFKNIFPNDVPNIFTVTTSSYQSGPEMVLLRGRIVVENNELLDDACCGTLLTSQPFSQYVYGRVNAVEKSVNSEYTPLSREPYMGNVATDASVDNSGDHSKEGYYFRKEYFDNMPKEALPPGQRKIHTSVKTAQPPGGSSNAFWMNE
ncbi:unnamed protein product [Trichobilharzia szidati]|nr:unnamed protein product [Trichobilharzia szidati]